MGKFFNPDPTEPCPFAHTGLCRPQQSEDKQEKSLGDVEDNSNDIHCGNVMFKTKSLISTYQE